MGVLPCITLHWTVLHPRHVQTDISSSLPVDMGFRLCASGWSRQPQVASVLLSSVVYATF